MFVARSGAAGVSQPWETNAVAWAFRRPRRADARRSWLHVFVSRIGKHAFDVRPDHGVGVKRTPLHERFADHGGLTPAAPGCVFVSRCAMFDFRGTASVSHTTAG
jgi:hypothetical protein